MDVTQILISGVGTLVVVVGTLLKIGLRTLENKLLAQDAKIEKKLDAALCEERHGGNTETCEKLFRHKHASTYPDGRGGEVIIP